MLFLVLNMLLFLPVIYYLLFQWFTVFCDSEMSYIINLIQVIVPLLYLLKTSEDQRFSDVFREYRNGALT